jgi:hypothetical protein
MPKLTEFTNPLTGQKGNLTDLKGLWGLVLGVVVMFAIFGTGQMLTKKIAGKIPGVDMTVEDPITRQATGLTKVII